MVQKRTKAGIIEVFFHYPASSFGVRELARKAGVSHPTVMRHLEVYKKENLVERTKKGEWQSANTLAFRRKKRLATIAALYECGLIDLIKEQCLPSTIILFGSAATGEDTEMSDIDLFIEAPQKQISTKKFEGNLHRKVSLTFGSFSKLTREFRTSLVNGVILDGGISL